MFKNVSSRMSAIRCGSLTVIPVDNLRVQHEEDKHAPAASFFLLLPRAFSISSCLAGLLHVSTSLFHGTVPLNKLPQGPVTLGGVIVIIL